MWQPATEPDEETEMSLYSGIDLHANNSVIVLLNEQDEVVYRKRLSNELPALLEQLAPYRAEVKGLVVESTYNWYWLVDGLMEAEYRVHLANPALVPFDVIRSRAQYFWTLWL